MSHEAEVLIPAQTGVDVLVLATMLPLAVFTLGCGLYFVIFPESLPASGGAELPFLSKTASDVVLLSGSLFAATIWLCARGFGALWRAVDRRPMLVAAADGLVFHPALCADDLPWTRVRRFRVAGLQNPYHVAIDLRGRIWTIETPLTARCVRIGALYMATAGFAPHELIARLEALREASSATGGQGAS